MDVRFVWRHLPLPQVHPHAELAARAAEAAAAQGAFWAFHAALLESQDDLTWPALLAVADALQLDRARFESDVRSARSRDRVAADVRSADSSGVAGTPTFFVNGRRHYGSYDIDKLQAAVAAAHQQASVAPGMAAHGGSGELTPTC